SLAGDPFISFLMKIEPDGALQARPAAEQKPGDDARLRNLQAIFALHANAPTTASGPEQTVQTALLPRHGWSWLRELSLRDLFRETQYGFWMLMLLSLAVGGVHALTPGHGKTLVAAYLVGERGTVGHALILGLVTTVTHTGVVIAVAAGLFVFARGGLTPAG